MLKMNFIYINIINMVEEVKKENSYGDHITFYNKVNNYEDVSKWAVDCISLVTNAGNSFYVIKEIKNDDGDIMTNRVKNLNHTLNKQIKIKNNDENINKSFKLKKIKEIIEENIEKITYRSMDFIPYSPIKLPKKYKNVLNTYRGPKIEYNKDFKINNKIINPFLTHIKEVLADNNKTNEEYILSMLAHYVQRPHVKTNVCMVFISDEEGAGKNLFFDNFNQKLIGSNYSTNIDNLDTLFTRFNGILSNKIVTVLDEVKTKFGGKSSDQFKSMITQKYLNLEEKGMEHIKINDYNNYIILTNNEVPVHIDISDRRFFVSNVSNKYVGNYNYFDNLQDSFDNDESIKHLYHYLLHYDISSFKPQRDIPTTERKIDIKYDTLKSPVKFMVAVAANKIDYGIDSKNIDSNTLYNAYLDFVATHCDRSTPVRKLDFFKKIKKLISIPIINYKDKKKNKIYNINKKMVKESLVKYFKTDIEDICEIMAEEFSFTDTDSESNIEDFSSTSNESNTEYISEESYSSTEITNNNNNLENIFTEIKIESVKNQAGLYKCVINNVTKFGSYDDLKKLIDINENKKFNTLLNV